MSAATRWSLVIVGILAANVLAMIMLAVIARNGDNQVIPAYYDRAVRYDGTLDEAARSLALGWTAEPTLTGAAVEVRVTDAEGRALADARVRVEGYQRAHAADRIAVDLVPLGDGRYRAALRSPRTGVHDLTITIERAGERFLRRAVVEAR